MEVDDHLFHDHLPRANLPKPPTLVGAKRRHPKKFQFLGGIGGQLSRLDKLLKPMHRAGFIPDPARISIWIAESCSTFDTGWTNRPASPK
jgi:hypothetical protein